MQRIVLILWYGIWNICHKNTMSIPTDETHCIDFVIVWDLESLSQNTMSIPTDATHGIDFVVWDLEYLSQKHNVNQEYATSPPFLCNLHLGQFAWFKQSSESPMPIFVPKTWVSARMGEIKSGVRMAWTTLLHATQKLREFALFEATFKGVSTRFGPQPS